jgi:flagellar motor switch protein FliG
MTVTDIQAFAAAPIDPIAGLTGRQKAAVLILQLGRADSARVLAHFSESDLEGLSTEIARIGTVPPEVSAAVAAEFAELLDNGGASSARGGIDAARDLLKASVGSERGDAIAERVSQNFVQLPFAFLQQLDHRQIVSFLPDEHPQTIALVLAHLPATLASLVLAGLSRELQADVAHRIAVMDRTSPDLIRTVEQSLERRLSSLGVPSDLSAVGGLRPLVDIINNADRNTERMILEGLEQIDSKLAEQVRAKMFMFEDIVTLDDRSIQLIVRQVQVADLATALKGVSESVRARVMQNMSERAAISLAEEIDLLGPVRVAAVEEAQAAVIREVRQLEESGQIVLSRGDEDAFVA